MLLSTRRTDAQRTATLQAFASGDLAVCCTTYALAHAVLCCFLGQAASLGEASGRDTLAVFGIRGLASGSNQGLPSRAQTMVSEQ